MAAAAAMGIATVALTAAPASAATTEWTRSCGTTYYGTVTKNIAYTNKGNSGSCAGHAWLKIRDKTGWFHWKHDPSIAIIDRSNSDNKILESAHKGCETCQVHYVIP